MEHSIELFQRSSSTITSKLFLWSFHNTASIIFCSFPFLPCAYEPFPPLPSLCKGGGKQGLVWKLNMLRSSRLVQASQSPCSFPTPSGTADRVTKPVFKAGWTHFETIPLCLKGEKSLVSMAHVLHGVPVPLIPSLVGSTSNTVWVARFKMGSSPASYMSCKQASARAPLMSSEDMDVGDIYRPWIILSSLPVPLCRQTKGVCVEFLSLHLTRSLQANAN